MNYKKPSSKSWASSFFRNQLKKLQSFTEDEPITAERRAQDFIGMLLQKIQHPDVRFCPLEFDRFQAAMALPPSSDCSGAVLYLHGGGYCCGGLEYAKGFGATLATEGGISVLCPAYRLAPEYPFPAALDDAMTAYRRISGRRPHFLRLPRGQKAWASPSGRSCRHFAMDRSDGFREILCRK